MTLIAVLELIFVGAALVIVGFLVLCTILAIGLYAYEAFKSLFG